MMVMDDDGDGDGHDHNLVTYLMIKINGNLDPPRLSLIFALIKSSPYCSWLSRSWCSDLDHSALGLLWRFLKQNPPRSVIKFQGTEKGGDINIWWIKFGWKKAEKARWSCMNIKDGWPLMLKMGYGPDEACICVFVFVIFHPYFWIFISIFICIFICMPLYEYFRFMNIKDPLLDGQWARWRRHGETSFCISICSCIHLVVFVFAWIWFVWMVWIGQMEESWKSLYLYLYLHLYLYFHWHEYKRWSRLARWRRHGEAIWPDPHSSLFRIRTAMHCRIVS